MFTKSGIMVGLGETREQVMQVMDDMRSADIDFITIGQYLQPAASMRRLTASSRRMSSRAYETMAYAKGFLMVASSPLTRSSHHAGDDFAQAACGAAATRLDMPNFHRDTPREVRAEADIRRHCGCGRATGNSCRWSNVRQCGARSVQRSPGEEQFSADLVVAYHPLAH